MLEHRRRLAVLRLAAGLHAALLVAVVVEQRVLGRQQPLAHVRRGHRLLREVERFEDRDLAVAIAVGRLGGERVDERSAEERRVLLVAGARRGDDHAAGARQRLDERSAGARRVHEHHALRRAASRAAARSPAAPCRARQVELRDLRREGPVPEEHDAPPYPPRRPSAASASNAFVTASRVAAASVSSVTFALSTPSFCDAVSASVVPHFLNSSPCSGVPASPTTTSRCVDCANAERAEQPGRRAPSSRHLPDCADALVLRALGAHASLHIRRRPHSAHTIADERHQQDRHVPQLALFDRGHAAPRVLQIVGQRASSRRTV